MCLSGKRWLIDQLIIYVHISTAKLKKNVKLTYRLTSRIRNIVSHINHSMSILVSGLVDNSGFRIKMSKTLRQYDAAVMELGLEYTDKMAIPPGQTAFPLSGYCVADCTRAALPATGIIIFGSQLHTHLRGVRVLTRHFRGEQELREVNRDDYYSNHFQEMRTLHYKPRVLPVRSHIAIIVI